MSDNLDEFMERFNAETVRQRQFGYAGKIFISYFWFTGWTHLSLGLHLCVRKPNIEIHLPFGFVRIGRE